MVENVLGFGFDRMAKFLWLVVCGALTVLGIVDGKKCQNYILKKKKWS